nr:serine/arginine repetitive matrix protein 1-like isoform X1 [Procambarus clarkii]XP_045623790.1 serine/arginine repetitive matrix protein 1-like isoform X1 [Procambarus clarkii]
MAISPRKRSVDGRLKSIPKGGKKESADDEWLPATNYLSAESQSLSKRVVGKRSPVVASKAKSREVSRPNRRQTLILKRIDVPLNFEITSPASTIRKTRRQSMAHFGKRESVQTNLQTTKLPVPIDDKLSPVKISKVKLPPSKPPPARKIVSMPDMIKTDRSVTRVQDTKGDTKLLRQKSSCSPDKQTYYTRHRSLRSSSSVRAEGNKKRKVEAEVTEQFQIEPSSKRRKLGPSLNKNLEIGHMVRSSLKLVKGKALTYSPKPERKNAAQSPKLERKNAVQSPKPERKNAVQSPKPERKNAVQSPKPERKNAVQSPKSERKNAVQSPKPERKNAVQSPKPERKNAVQSPKPERKNAVRSPRPERKNAVPSPKPERKNAVRSPKPERKNAVRSPRPERKNAVPSPIPERKNAVQSPRPERKNAVRSPKPDKRAALQSQSPKLEQKDAIQSSNLKRKRDVSQSPELKKSRGASRALELRMKDTLETSKQERDSSISLNPTMTKNTKKSPKLLRTRDKSPELKKAVSVNKSPRIAVRSPKITRAVSTIQSPKITRTKSITLSRKINIVKSPIPSPVNRKNSLGILKSSTTHSRAEVSINSTAALHENISRSIARVILTRPVRMNTAPSPRPKLHLKTVSTPSPKPPRMTRSSTKSSKRVRIVSASPESFSAVRKTPSSKRKLQSKPDIDIGSTPVLPSARVQLQLLRRSSPLRTTCKASNGKVKPFTPKPDPLPSHILKQTLKKKVDYERETVTQMKDIGLDNGECGTPNQESEDPLDIPSTPFSTSNLPPTPKSSRQHQISRVDRWCVVPRRAINENVTSKSTLFSSVNVCMESSQALDKPTCEQTLPLCSAIPRSSTPIEDSSRLDCFTADTTVKDSTTECEADSSVEFSNTCVSDNNEEEDDGSDDGDVSGESGGEATSPPQSRKSYCMVM